MRARQQKVKGHLPNVVQTLHLAGRVLKQTETSSLHEQSQKKMTMRTPVLSILSFLKRYAQKNLAIPNSCYRILVKTDAIRIRLINTIQPVDVGRLLPRVHHHLAALTTTSTKSVFTVISKANIIQCP
jgi:hypothetical protein